MSTADPSDLGQVVGISQTVSGQTVWQRTIEGLMHAAIESTGALRGLLILAHGDELQLTAEATNSGQPVVMNSRDLIDAVDVLPDSLVRYVWRKHETVLLDDASARNPFSEDLYFTEYRVRSVICLPLINQSISIGVLYLESDKPSFFNKDAVTLLNVLASQAAIALENARVYLHLEHGEAKLRGLVDANIIGIFTWSIDGAILGANDEFLRTVQYSRDDLVSGRVRWTDLTPPDWRSVTERAVAHLITTGKHPPYEKEWFRKDGARVPILIGTACFERNRNEGVGFVLDLTATKQAQAALRSSEAYLREAQQLTHTGSWAWNPATGDIRYWSEECFRVLGFDPASASPPVFETFFQRIHLDDQPASRDRFDTAIRGKADFDMNYRLIRPDGETRVIQAVGHPILSPSGDLTEFVGTVVDITDRVRAEAELRQAFEHINHLKEQLYRENLALRDEVDRTSMFEEIIGTSSALKVVLSRIARVAPTDSTVLITGETGTGKELIARAVHKRSRRSGRAFVSVNCAALSPSLIPSELFGHEKGAFTGAIQRRLGRFELADGGTIFLDEVGELPPDTQVALLRVLQEREFERVGGTQSIHVDVRVIAATNRDLKSAVSRGTFREDLFYRLNVFPIAVPALRERKDDILTLVEYFVQRYSRAAGKKIVSIDKNTLRLLQSYEWPGNIRELQNVIERSVILTSSDVLSVDELWLPKEHSARPSAVEKVAALSRAAEARSERQIIEEALVESRGRVSGPSGAAARLRVPASTLATRIKALKINRHQFKFG